MLFGSMTNEPSTTNRAVSFSWVLTEMIVNGRQWKRKESARYEYSMFQVYYKAEVLNIVKGNLGIINEGWNEYGRVLIQLNAG